MADFHEFGKKAEEFALHFLVSKGYCILHTNWTYGHKELDIVCTDGRQLIVVEVKARRQAYFSMPEDLISVKKERYLLAAAEHYLFRYKVNLPLRIDLIAVIQSGSMMDLEHVEDVIVPHVV